MICLIFFSFCFAAEIEKYEDDESRKDGDVKKYLDIISNKNIKLSERVLIPVQQYPKVRHSNHHQSHCTSIGKTPENECKSM